MDGGIFNNGIQMPVQLQKINEPVNWQQVRIQAAIAAMQGMVISDAYCSEEPVGPAYQIKRRKWPPARIAQEAVAYADFLIAELKKGGEE